MSSLQKRQEWLFFGSMWRAHPGLSAAWWAVMAVRAVLPPLLAIAIGTVVGAVQDHRSLTGPLVFMGVTFVVLQVLPPLHQVLSANVGSRLANWLNRTLMVACLTPDGIGHLERPDLINDLNTARDFDLGIQGPPLHVGMDFIAGGLAQLLGGIAAALVLFAFAWWAPPLLLLAWGCTHWLLRESGVWKDRNTDEVQVASRHTEYAYRLAVDPPAAKEVRLFGLAPWVIDRFVTNSRRLYELKHRATKLREKSVVWCLLIVAGANVLFFWRLAEAGADGSIDLARIVVFAQTAFAVSTVAFGGFNWALDFAAAPVAAVLRLEAAMAPAGALSRAGTVPATAMPAVEVRFRDVHFAYPAASGSGEERVGAPVLDGFDLVIPAGTSLAIVGQNGAGKTTLAKLLCRLYDPQSGSIEVDGVDLRDIDVDSWRGRITAVFQDFVRFELPLRDNVVPAGGGGRDDTVTAALVDAGADQLASLDTPLHRGYPGGTDLSGGQWQRVALARALAAVRDGAGLVLLDEPTAMLDVRGESEIFERVLAATRQCTTILVSHRFSTVRQADRICVVEHGRVVELGTHDELIALGGRYRTMYELQASRFTETELSDDGEEVLYERL